MLDAGQMAETLRSPWFGGADAIRRAPRPAMRHDGLVNGRARRLWVDPPGGRERHWRVAAGAPRETAKGQSYNSLILWKKFR